MTHRTMPPARAKSLLDQADKAIAHGGRERDITHLSADELKHELSQARRIMDRDREILAALAKV